MITVTTASGFTAEVDPAKLDDWDFMNAVIDSESEDTGKAVRAQIFLCKFLLGEDGEKRMKDHLTAIHGHAPATAVIAEVTEIFNLIKEQNDIKK